MKQIVALILLLPTICLGAGVVRTLDSPDTNISGLAFSEGTLFTASVAGTSTYIYYYNSSGSYLGYDYLC